MENASKALLIAASVLIAILLIALGVRVLNSTAEPTDQVQINMQTTQIEMFNNKFIPYIGDGKSLVEVKSLADKVIASNAASTSQEITLDIDIPNIAICTTTDAKAISSAVAKLPRGSYEIEVTEYKEGMISVISITK